MTAVILVIHILLAIALILLVLLQQSEGGLGGLGGGGGGMGGFMTGRATANLLTRATAILAALFFMTSLGLAIMADQNRRPSSILDLSGPANQVPGTSQPAAPSAPVAPSQ